MILHVVLLFEFFDKIFCAFVISPMRAVCLVHLILLCPSPGAPMGCSPETPAGLFLSASTPLPRAIREKFAFEQVFYFIKDGHCERQLVNYSY
jgi:hypothetical protein